MVLRSRPVEVYRMNSTGREMWQWTQIGARAPAHGPNGRIAVASTRPRRRSVGRGKCRDRTLLRKARQDARRRPSGGHGAPSHGGRAAMTARGSMVEGKGADTFCKSKWEGPTRRAYYASLGPSVPERPEMRLDKTMHKIMHRAASRFGNLGRRCFTCIVRDSARGLAFRRAH